MYTNPIFQAQAGGIVVSVDFKELRMYEYDLKADEDVVEAVREGDSDALEYLINKYRNFVRAKARSYFF